MKKVNLVICGLGYISERVANGAKHASNVHLYGCVSSNQNKGEAMKEKYHMDHYFSSYEEMYQDENVDLVYFTTPNHVHETQIKEALSHHKHVICEKPMVETQEKISSLFAYAKQQGCFLMEAEKTFFSPLLEKVKAMISEGAIGDVYHIEADYCYDIRKLNYPNNHWVFQANGGCALDVGVYPICLSHYFVNSTIKKHSVIKHTYQDFTCDFFYQTQIQYDNGISATLTSNWLQEKENKGYAYLYGTKGYFKIPAYWKDNKAYLVKDGTSTLIEVAMDSDFTGEITHAASCILKGMTQSDILDENMSHQILDVIYE